MPAIRPWDIQVPWLTVVLLNYAHEYFSDHSLVHITGGGDHPSCISQLFVPVTNTGDNQLIKRKGLFFISGM
jgi:hypothetical protein